MDGSVLCPPSLRISEKSGGGVCVFGSLSCQGFRHVCAGQAPATGGGQQRKSYGEKTHGRYV